MAYEDQLRQQPVVGADSGVTRSGVFTFYSGHTREHEVRPIMLLQINPVLIFTHDSFSLNIKLIIQIHRTLNMKRLDSLLRISILALALSTVAEVSVGADQSSLPNLSKIGGDFTLHSQDGDVSLSAFRGKVVLLYFGYINCPDACPTTLSDWSKAFKHLTDEEQSNVRGIIISVDPERDSLKELKTYAQYFHKNILAATGSMDELKEVTKKYGAKIYIQPHAPGANYSVEHSYNIFLIDTRGKTREVLPFSTSVTEFSETLKRYLP